MTVTTTYVNCANCNGRGLFGKTKTCTACDGRGEIKVAQPPIPCPDCNGTNKTVQGDEPVLDNPLCPTCGGVGWASVARSNPN